MVTRSSAVGKQPGTTSPCSCSQGCELAGSASRSTPEIRSTLLIRAWTRFSGSGAGLVSVSGDLAPGPCSGVGNITPL